VDAWRRDLCLMRAISDFREKEARVNSVAQANSIAEFALASFFEKA